MDRVHDLAASTNPVILVAAFLAVPILTYLLLPALRRLLTPGGIPGIPALPRPVPLWGDIPLMGKIIGDNDSFSYLFDWCAKEMGPISQVRAGWFLK